jgi:zinc-ribbon domain
MDELRIASPSGNTAKTLILIGLILQVIEVVVALLLFLVVIVSVFFALLLLPFVVLEVVWLAIVYLFSYRRVASGEYERARTPTLVIAILSLLTVNLISGILYIIAWVKLGDAIAERAARRATTQAAMGQTRTFVAPGVVALRNCPSCGTTVVAGATYCPACGAAVS